MYKNHRSIKPIVDLANAIRSEIIEKKGYLKISDKNKNITGSLRLIQCENSNYMEDLKDRLRDDKSKSIAILVPSNRIVALISSALIQDNFKVIPSHSSDFSIRHLDEIRYFIDQLRSGVEFDEAKKDTKEKYNSDYIFYKAKEDDSDYSKIGRVFLDLLIMI